MSKLTSIWAIISGRSNVPMPPGFADKDDRYMVDFRPDRFEGYAVAQSEPDVSPATKEKTVKVPVSPKSVLQELGRLPTRWSLEGLDAKIAILEDKRDLIRQRFALEEVEGLIRCLKNRKKYDRKARDGKTYREFFSRFDATDHERVTAFVKKHNLVVKDAEIFVPEFPAEAVSTMIQYTNKVDELCSKRPRYSVIATSDQFKEANAKRDPILLAQSPFGFYYYILGAWDKEMLNLAEL